ncbi:hypothetical protein CBOM_00763 [Ceraceosorus bombacis]|uniref:Uncharacterized protein n=1 Tax=Ceraceosorus bombacis TaxID=401625 RepID=A0A0P1B9X9_9BASI|nr:hypothetical protein CBOM_00763 [Ceraceosorus bombacis]
MPANTTLPIVDTNPDLASPKQRMGRMEQDLHLVLLAKRLEMAKSNNNKLTTTLGVIEANMKELVANKQELVTKLKDCCAGSNASRAGSVTGSNRKLNQKAPTKATYAEALVHNLMEFSGDRSPRDSVASGSQQPADVPSATIVPSKAPMGAAVPPILPPTQVEELTSLELEGLKIGSKDIKERSSCASSVAPSQSSQAGSNPVGQDMADGMDAADCCITYLLAVGGKTPDDIGGGGGNRNGPWPPSPDPPQGQTPNYPRRQERIPKSKDVDDFDPDLVSIRLWLARAKNLQVSSSHTNGETSAVVGSLPGRSSYSPVLSALPNLFILDGTAASP